MLCRGPWAVGLFWHVPEAEIFGPSLAALLVSRVQAPERAADLFALDE